MYTFIILIFILSIGLRHGQKIFGQEIIILKMSLEHDNSRIILVLFMSWHWLVEMSVMNVFSELICKVILWHIPCFLWWLGKICKLFTIYFYFTIPTNIYVDSQSILIITLVVNIGVHYLLKIQIRFQVLHVTWFKFCVSYLEFQTVSAEIKLNLHLFYWIQTIQNHMIHSVLVK